MKILALADRPPSQSIISIVTQSPVDIICTLGDLDQSSISELEFLKLPKLGVYGNHDSGLYFDPLGIKNLHLSTFESDGLLFGGFESCVRYKNDPDAKMYTQEEASALLSDFPRVDILLCHCPPFGINDEPDDISHQGFCGLLTYLAEKNPKFSSMDTPIPQPTSLLPITWRPK